jgi:hypothetical protein
MRIGSEHSPQPWVIGPPAYVDKAEVIIVLVTSKAILDKSHGTRIRRAIGIYPFPKRLKVVSLRQRSSATRLSADRTECIGEEILNADRRMRSLPRNVGDGSIRTIYVKNELFLDSCATQHYRDAPSPGSASFALDEQSADPTSMRMRTECLADRTGSRNCCSRLTD